MRGSLARRTQPRFTRRFEISTAGRQASVERIKPAENFCLKAQAQFSRVFCALGVQLSRDTLFTRAAD